VAGGDGGDMEVGGGGDAEVGGEGDPVQGDGGIQADADAGGNGGAAGDTNDNAAGGNEGASDGMEEGAAVKAAFDPSRDLSEDVVMELLALMEATREEIEEDEAPGRTRRRLAAGGTVERRFTYATTSTAVCELYESNGDWERAEAAVEQRKGFRTCRFSSFRLRAVQRCELKCGGAGLSLQGLQELFDLLDTWDGSKPGMPIHDQFEQPIRKLFNSGKAFKDALRDDVDDAVLGAGWMKCTLVLDGERFVALFRPVLQVVLGMLKAGKKVQFWSGEDGPASPTDQRESPLDGDAIRLNDAAVMAEKKDPS